MKIVAEIEIESWTMHRFDGNKYHLDLWYRSGDAELTYKREKFKDFAAAVAYILAHNLQK